MDKIKNMINKVLAFFLIFVSLFGLGGCDSNKNTSELSRYGVNISNLKSGIVLESKIKEESDLSSVRLSTGNPKAYETYYLVYRFKVTSLEELEEDNKLFVNLSFDNEGCGISNGKMIEAYSNGEIINLDLFRDENDATTITSRVELPDGKDQSVNVTVAWKFFCDYDKLTYTISFGSNQLDISGNKLNLMKTLDTKKSSFEKPQIYYDEELNSIVWDSIPNYHYYNVYIDDKILGCDPEVEDSYPFTANPTNSGKEYLTLETLKSLGVSGKVKVKIRIHPLISDLANPVYSNTITVTVD